jgi:hypothetical protein
VLQNRRLLVVRLVDSRCILMCVPCETVKFRSRTENSGICITSYRVLLVGGTYQLGGRRDIKALLRKNYTNKTISLALDLYVCEWGTEENLWT